MKKDTIHFLLTPDKTSARRLRREVADRSAMLGVQVGTWLELAELARKSYLLPEPVNDWDARLAEAARKITDAFWAESLKVAEPETLASIGRSLRMLIEGAGPDGRLEEDINDILGGRARRHLADLVRLHDEMGVILPDDLSLVRALLDTDSERAVRSIAIYAVEDMPKLALWQKALAEKLNVDGGNRHNSVLSGMQADLLQGSSTEDSPPALKNLQTSLYQSGAKKVEKDTSVRFLAARDYLEEVEVAAGMIGKLLDGNPELKTSDIALLIPSDISYAEAVRNVFGYAGLPLSGLEMERSVRDLGREAVLYFLFSYKKPAPAMALAAFLTSPLMSWSAGEGNALAQRVMERDFKLKAPEGFSASGKEILDLISDPVEKPEALAASLARFSKLLKREDYLAPHLERAKNTVGELAGLLAGRKDIPWNELIKRVAPQDIKWSDEQELTQEGIALFYEHEEPWRSVDHLFMLGFSSGRYPAEPGVSPVFSESDKVLLHDRLAYKIDRMDDVIGGRRALLRRQISATKGSLTILMPRRDRLGKSVSPSSSLTFMAKLFSSVGEPEELIVELGSESERADVEGLPLAPHAEPISPRALQIRDLDLGRNLLELRKKADGSPAPESPSGIETLMVSPFAWLLKRTGLEPKGWAPESLDILAKGTLAHEVFEHLFPTNKPLPSESEIRREVPLLLGRAFKKITPFLFSEEWRVERSHLEKEVASAAIRWKALLENMDARILGAEVWLKGEFDGFPIHGKTDLILALPDGRIYVVDYKKSKSNKRRNQMSKGYDSQASLYRQMIRTGGPAYKDEKNEKLKEELKNAEIGALYYLMNDSTALADSNGWMGRDIAGIYELGQNISVNAMAMIRDRMSNVKKGIVLLNKASDEKWFMDEAGVTAYALDASPLVRLFMHPKEES